MQNTKKFETKSVLLATVLVVALVFAWGVRNLFKPRIHSPRVECTANLRAIDGAIQQWAIENKLSGTNRVDFIVIKDFLKGSRMPTCMANGIYTATTVSCPPTCSLFALGHSL